jgi:hypothetical protein
MISPFVTFVDFAQVLSVTTSRFSLSICTSKWTARQVAVRRRHEAAALATRVPGASKRETRRRPDRLKTAIRSDAAMRYCERLANEQTRPFGRALRPSAHLCLQCLDACAAQSRNAQMPGNPAWRSYRAAANVNLAQRGFKRKDFNNRPIVRTRVRNTSLSHRRDRKARGAHVTMHDASRQHSRAAFG